MAQRPSSQRSKSISDWRNTSSNRNLKDSLGFGCGNAAGMSLDDSRFILLRLTHHQEATQRNNVGKLFRFQKRNFSKNLNLDVEKSFLETRTCQSYFTSLVSRVPRNHMSSSVYLVLHYDTLSATFFPEFLQVPDSRSKKDHPGCKCSHFLSLPTVLQIHLTPRNSSQVYAVMDPS